MSGGPRPHPPQPPVELPEGVSHGGFRAYQAYGCRCAECQEHSRTYAKAIYRTRRTRGPRDVPPGKHGLAGYSYYGCRCDICADARWSYERGRRGLIREDEQ